MKKQTSTEKHVEMIKNTAGMQITAPPPLEKDFTWTGSSTEFTHTETAQPIKKSHRIGWLEQLSFTYFNGVMAAGQKRALQKEDIPFFSPFNDSYPSENAAFMEKFKEYCLLQDKKGNPITPSKALRKALWGQHGGLVIRGVCFFVISRIFSFAKPFLIGRLVVFFADDDAELWEGFLYGNLFAFCSLMDMTFIMQVFFYGILTSVSVNQGLLRMIFLKTFKLAPERQEGDTSGKIVNLMSVDAEQIANFFTIGVMGFGAPIDMVVATVLLVYTVGAEAFIVWAVIFLIYGTIACMGPVIGKWQKAKLESTDRRTNYIDEVLHGIKLFKLYAWEEVLEKRIHSAREDEVAKQKGMYYRLFGVFSLNQCADVFFLLSIFSIFYARGKEVKLDTIFISIGLIGILKASLLFSGFFLQQVFPLLVSLDRLAKFFVSKEINEYVERGEDDDTIFRFDNATLSWRDEKSGEDTAEGTALKDTAEGTALKDTAEGTALKDTAEGTALKDAAEGTALKDTVDDQGDVKDDFLLSNIDIRIQRGLLTAIVGPVASGKSSLLNAVVGEMYLKQGKVLQNLREGETVDFLGQTHYILNASVRDNILMGAAFDEHRYVQAIRNASLIADINGSFPDADKTEIGERGITLSGGQKSRVVLRALYRQCDIYLLDDVLSAVDPDVGDEIFQRAILGQMMDSTRVIVMNSHLHNLMKCDHIIVIDKGKIMDQGKYEDLVEKYPGLMRPKIGAEERAILERGPTIRKEKIKKGSKKAKKLVEEESRVIGKVKGEVYLYWFSGMLKCWRGAWLPIFIIVIVHLLVGIMTVAPPAFLALWASAKDGGGAAFGERSDSWYFSTYALLNSCTVLIYICSLFMCIEFAMNTSERIHNDAWSGTLAARLVYFDQNPIGRILNRFTSDVANNDGKVIWQFQQGVFLCALLIVYLFVQVFAMPWVIILIIPLVYIFYRMTLYYLVSSRELQRLKALTLSPIISHFETCVNSISIIRVCNYSQQENDRNEHLVSDFARVNWSFMTSQRWFGVRIGFVCTIITFFLANMCVHLKSSFADNAAILGLAVKFSDDISTFLQFCVRIMVEWMNCMVGVERLMDTRDSEPKEDDRILPIDPPSSKWPSEGKIEFKDVRFKYREELPEIIKGLSFSVKPGETIGICGRTGSGKSTILLALYRMYSHISGTIEIDGVDTKDLGLKTLRSALSIIPQDAVILSGSMRYNLDPLHIYTDEQILKVLDTMKFSTHFHVEKGNMLAYEVAEKGENLSAGQRQLVCIARVLLQDRKIVLLDEATANIDAATDLKIQKILRDFFKGKTVLTIAHRIDTIMDSDRVLLLDKGDFVEFGNPRELLDDPNSEFSRFVKGDATQEMQSDV